MSTAGWRKLQCKRSLETTLQKCREDIEKIQEAGGFPHDYSLGWTNAMIFVLHRLNGKSDQPKFYDHKTSIGELPRPVQFQHKTKEDAALEEEWETLCSQLIARAKDVVDSKPKEHIDVTCTAIEKLGAALAEIEVWENADNPKESVSGDLNNVGGESPSHEVGAPGEQVKNQDSCGSPG